MVLLPARDFAKQTDLEVGTSVVREMRRALDSGIPFYSASFSRRGETFCYLKIDTGDLSMEDRFVRKQRLAITWSL